MDGIGTHGADDSFLNARGMGPFFKQLGTDARV